MIQSHFAAFLPSNRKFVNWRNPLRFNSFKEKLLIIAAPFIVFSSVLVFAGVVPYLFTVLVDTPVSMILISIITCRTYYQAPFWAWYCGTGVSLGIAGETGVDRYIDIRERLETDYGRGNWFILRQFKSTTPWVSKDEQSFIAPSFGRYYIVFRDRRAALMFKLSNTY